MLTVIKKRNDKDSQYFGILWENFIKYFNRWIWNLNFNDWTYLQCFMMWFYIKMNEKKYSNWVGCQSCSHFWKQQDVSKLVLLQ